jgi:hypothetical protein
MERMVNRRLPWFLEYNQHHIINQQCGFRKGRSTLGVKAILKNETFQPIHKKDFMSTCSLDFSSAHDQCWRRGILKNFVKMKINGRMLAHSQNFKSIYSIKVASGNNHSDEQKIKNGCQKWPATQITG